MSGDVVFCLFCYIYVPGFMLCYVLLSDIMLCYGASLCCYVVHIFYLCFGTMWYVVLWCVIHWAQAGIGDSWPNPEKSR